MHYILSSDSILVNNYIEDTSTFPPSIWASASSYMSLTTNARESFNSEFNSNFYHHYPNIIKIIEILKMFQTNTYLRYEQQISIDHKK